MVWQTAKVWSDFGRTYASFQASPKKCPLTKEMMFLLMLHYIMVNTCSPDLVWIIVMATVTCVVLFYCVFPNTKASYMYDSSTSSLCHCSKCYVCFIVGLSLAGKLKRALSLSSTVGDQITELVAALPGEIENVCICFYSYLTTSRLLQYKSWRKLLIVTGSICIGQFGT